MKLEQLSKGMKYTLGQGWIAINDKGVVTLTEAGMKANIVVMEDPSKPTQVDHVHEMRQFLLNLIEQKTHIEESLLNFLIMLYPTALMSDEQEKLRNLSKA